MLKLCVVFEAQGDAQLGCSLADRVLVDCVEWLRDQPELLGDQREWISEYCGSAFRWDSIANLGRDMNIRIRGYEEGEKDFPDFKAAVRALRVIRSLFEDIDAVVLIRDTDDQPDRINGLNQAKKRFEGQPKSFRVLVGAAITKRECWVLAGFVPRDDAERVLLDEERQNLGFNPTTHSHRLTAKNSAEEDKKSAKRVLKKLTQDNPSREETCWTETPLVVLEANGNQNGLASYFKQVKDVLVPMVRRVNG